MIKKGECWVDVDTRESNRTKLGIRGLGIECFSTGYTVRKAGQMRIWFDNDVDAMTFLEIYEGTIIQFEDEPDYTPPPDDYPEDKDPNVEQGGDPGAPA
jgi:hypothetical protein